MLTSKRAIFKRNLTLSLNTHCLLSEGVRRNALRVLHPKSPHSEEMVQYIEWRTPCGYAAVWLQGSAVQGRHDRPSV